MFFKSALEPFHPKGKQANWMKCAYFISTQLSITLYSFSWVPRHIICGLDFQLTLSLTRGAVQRGTNHRPPLSAQAIAMWNLQTVGNKGGVWPPFFHCILPHLSLRDWILFFILLAIKPWQHISLSGNTGTSRYPVKSKMRAYFFKSKEHMAKHVNDFYYHQTKIKCFTSFLFNRGIFNKK